MKLGVMNQEQIEDYVAENGLDDEMYFQLHSAYRDQRVLLRKAAEALTNRRDYDTAAEIHTLLGDPPAEEIYHAHNHTDMKTPCTKCGALWGASYSCKE